MGQNGWLHIDMSWHECHDNNEEKCFLYNTTSKSIKQTEFAFRVQRYELDPKSIFRYSWGRTRLPEFKLSAFSPVGLPVILQTDLDILKEKKKTPKLSNIFCTKLFYRKSVRV